MRIFLINLKITIKQTALRDLTLCAFATVWSDIVICAAVSKYLLHIDETDSKKYDLSQKEHKRMLHSIAHNTLKTTT